MMDRVVASFSPFFRSPPMRLIPLLLGTCFGSRDLLSKTNLDPLKITRMFVISDVHGDYEALIHSLRLAVESAMDALPEDKRTEVSYETLVGYLEEALGDEVYLRDPIFSNARYRFTLVQMGDLIDRGDKSKKCLQAMALVERVIGFSVIQLVGNHEVGALTGILSKYVNPSDDLVRDDGGSGFLWEYLKNNTLMMSRLGGSHISMEEGKPSSNAATLFVHAGFHRTYLNGLIGEADRNNPDHPWYNPITYNTEWLRRLDAPGPSKVVMDKIHSRFLTRESLLQTRAMASRETDCTEVDEILRMFKVARIVIGHTTMIPSRAMELNCGGKIILTDSGMSKFVVPGSIHVSLPNVLVINLYHGRLVGIQSHCIRPDTGPNKVHVRPLIHRDGKPAQESLTDQPSVGKKRSQRAITDHGSNDAVIERPDGGVRVVVQGETQYLLDRIASGRHPGIPRIDLLHINNGLNSSTGAVSSVYLIHSDDTRKITSIDAPVVLAVKQILAHIHSFDACIGSAVDPISVFGLTPSGQVQLVNFSNLHACLADEKSGELNTFESLLITPPTGELSPVVRF
jgi:hypothetical protein